MKNGPFVQRVGFALTGLGEGWRRERSFRTQVAIAALVAAALAVLRPSAIWWALIGLVVAIVLAMELLNSALEALVDLLHPDSHPEVRILKDMAAASVLLVSCGAVAVAVGLIVSMGAG
jgi:diacylglycerol kinase (ATP)